MRIDANKTKAPALVRGGFAKTVSSALTDCRHSTRPHVGRKPDMHGRCPVCNSLRYLGKQLALSLDGSQHCAAVCESCHAAASVSAAYSLTIAHRMAQHKQHQIIKGAMPC